MRIKRKLHSPLIYKSFLLVLQNSYAGFSHNVWPTWKGKLWKRLGNIRERAISTPCTVWVRFASCMNLISAISLGGTQYVSALDYKLFAGRNLCI